MQSFWSSRVASVTANDIRSNYLAQISADRKARWQMRKNVRNDGVVSNLFPLDVAAQSAHVYRYDLVVTKRAAPVILPAGSSSGMGSSSALDPSVAVAQGGSADEVPQMRTLQVSPTRAWRMFAQALRRHALPPLVRVTGSVYAAAPLPPEVLQLDPSFFDIGWQKCELQFAGKQHLSELPPQELKALMNKIIPWALSFHARKHGGYAMVREVDGKMVSTEDGVLVSGLRVFRGTTASVVHVNTAGEHHVGSAATASAKTTSSGDPQGKTTTKDEPLPPHVVPESAVLKTLRPNTPMPPSGLLVACEARVRNFVFKGKPVAVFLVRDASGSTSLTLWGAQPDALTPGKRYDLRGLRCKNTDARFGKRGTLDVELEGGETAVVVPVETPTAPAPTATTTTEDDNAAAKKEEGNANDVCNAVDAKAKSDAASSSSSSSSSSSLLPLTARDGVSLALRLDTRCTVASDRSVLDDIRRHFGEQPYNDEKKRVIARAVQGTPVVLSTNLRHAVVKALRFDYASPEEAPLDPHLRLLSRDLVGNQPYAVLSNYSIVPLQVLHCCFAPGIRSWSEISVPACSFLPNKRNAVLNKFRSALVEGMQQWSIHLREQGLGSTAIALLDAPEPRPISAVAAAASSAAGKTPPGRTANPKAAPGAGVVAAAAGRSRVKVVMFVSIVNPQLGTSERDACTNTATALARAFRSPLVRATTKEPDALRSIDEALRMKDGSLREKDCAVVCVVPVRETRATRWLTAELLRRGIMPTFVRGADSEKRQKLLAENVRFNLQTRAADDPVAAYDLPREVPCLRGRNSLFIGVDACHTPTLSTGAMAGVLIGGRGAASPTSPTSSSRSVNRLISNFWRSEIRGREVEQVADAFGQAIADALRAAPENKLDEIVVFQDGSVFAELNAMRAHVPVGTGLTFLCLHKRSHVRFVHRNAAASDTNVAQGTVVQTLTPMTHADEGLSTPSFYLQAHDCAVSTARTVQYKVHASSPTFPIADVQKAAFTLAHVGSPLSTKLPLPTRCAHRLASIAERLADAHPAFANLAAQIPEPLCHRPWFL